MTIDSKASMKHVQVPKALNFTTKIQKGLSKILLTSMPLRKHSNTDLDNTTETLKLKEILKMTTPPPTFSQENSPLLAPSTAAVAGEALQRLLNDELRDTGDRPLVAVGVLVAVLDGSVAR